MRCKICQSKLEYAFSEKVLGSYDAKYNKCKNCGFLSAKNPIWLSEAYTQPITNSDTGLLERNIILSKQVSVLINAFFLLDGTYLDYAGGYGVFTRLMRDIGFDFFHIDPYTTNLFSKEFEWDKNTKINGVTCFECVEHFEDPIRELKKIFSISKTIFISTDLLPNTIPKKDWNYYGFEHGQHISFYSDKTLNYIANYFGVFVVSVKNFHLFSPVKINSKKMKKLILKADKLPYPFAQKTLFKKVEKKMRKRRKN